MDNVPQEKLKNIKLVGFDVDGVLTAGEIIYTDDGTQLKIFNVKDGYGMKYLADKGMPTFIITGRESAVVKIRSKELGIKHLHQGVKDKLAILDAILQERGLTYKNVAYMGDDLPDICILEKVGLAACPADAVEDVKRICNFVSKYNGGKGAARELCDKIIDAWLSLA